MTILPAPLPKPTTPLEGRLLAVLQAYETRVWRTYDDGTNFWNGLMFCPRSAATLVEVFAAAARGERYLVRTSTVLYRDVLRESPEIFQMLRPYIRLSATAEKRTLEHHAQRKAQLGAWKAKQVAQGKAEAQG